MYISKFSVKNYKSFNQTSELEFTIGINIITGQNNAGKTALLEALSSKFSNIPHRSTKTLPTSESTHEINSEVTLEFSILREVMEDYIFNEGTFQMFSHLNRPPSNFDYATFIERYFGEQINIKAQLVNGSLYFASFSVSKPLDPSLTVDAFVPDKKSKKIKFSQRQMGPDSSNSIASKILNNIYCFKAERLKIGSSSSGVNKVLSPDASNLPEVLNILRGDPIRFERYNSYVRRVFPQIYHVNIRPIGSSTCEIVVWNEDPKLMRSDLVVPLAACGTGISQVLAILYVVLTSDSPRIIIIDEPNSFLHPGAARKLIEILKEHPQHQFIISTHSPSTLAASDPKTIHIVRIKDAESSVESINISETNRQQVYLAEIGAKLSDVFGADNILWVEGKTEEICFPRIIEKMIGLSLMGTVIVAVINTGDFQRKRNADLIVRVYDKLSKGSGLLPPAVGFVFDTEQLTITDKEDLQRRSNNTVSFLERRMIENYLLNANGILNIFRSTPEIADLKITLEDIQKWIDENKWKKEYMSKEHSTKKSDESWLANVDGAKFLSDLFNSVSKQKLAFDKLKHSVALCDWVIENSFDDLKDIQKLLRNVLKKA